MSATSSCKSLGVQEGSTEGWQVGISQYNGLYFYTAVEEAMLIKDSNMGSAARRGP